MEGQSKDFTANVVISTWQSIYTLKEKQFSYFDVVIVDEVHTAKAKSIKSIMEKMKNCKYRFGLTGTLDGILVNQLVLEGLFGPVRKVTSTAELIEKNIVTDLEIKCLVLKHQAQPILDYRSEIDYIINNEHRNNFIKNLAVSLKGNTLILFQYISHGEILRDLIKDSVEQNRNVYFVYGKVGIDEREYVRNIIEKEENAIIIASVVFSTGVSMNRLHNIIFVSPSKARIRVLQSIGRGLRKSADKLKCVLFDLADDIRNGSRFNYTLNHFVERIKYYNQEKFNYKIYRIDMDYDSKKKES